MTHNESNVRFFDMHTPHFPASLLTLRLVFSVLDIIMVFMARYFLVNVCNSYVRWIRMQ